MKGQERDSRTFDLLIEFLTRLEDNSLKIKNYQLPYQYFFWNFVSLQGYKLEVDKCAACQIKLNPYKVYFSGKEGGIICSNCIGLDKKAQKINSDIVKVLRIILKKDWDTLSKLKIEQPSQKLLSNISENAIPLNSIIIKRFNK
jgi:DNA repair protein RecO (recombination protein O)